MVNSPGDKQQSHPGDDELGPVGFLAIEFPNSRITAPGFERLLSLTDQGVVGILVLEFIATDCAGNARRIGVSEILNRDVVDRGVWAGASSGMLDVRDVVEIAAATA